MTEFSQTIKIPYDNLDYSNTKNMIDWVLKSLFALFGDGCAMVFHMSYSIGNISCISDSLDDFIDNAYGVRDFKFNRVDIGVFKIDKEVSEKNAVVLVDNHEITVFAFEKNLLEQIINSLTTTTLTEDETENTINNIFNAPVIMGKNSNFDIDDTVIGNDNNNAPTRIETNGNGNSVESTSNIGSNNIENKATDKKSFWGHFLDVIKPVFSKIIWLIICAGVSAVVALLIK